MDGPDLVHYLPIGTTILSVLFVVILLARASSRQWAPHLVWWAIGVFFYGLGTAVESSITLWGNTPMLNKTWYWAGAILGGYPLGTGSLYLIGRRKLADILTAITLTLVVIVSVLVFLSPVDAVAIAAESHRPSGKFIEWQWVRLTTPFINLYAAAFLIGGALYSTLYFLFEHKNLQRAIGTSLIALGGLLPGIGGSMAKADIVEALYVGEFLGIIFIWIGFHVCVRAPKAGLPAQSEPAGVQPEPTPSA